MKFFQELALVSHLPPSLQSSGFQVLRPSRAFLKNLFLNVILTHETEHISLAIRVKFLAKAFLLKTPLSYVSYPLYLCRGGVLGQGQRCDLSEQGKELMGIYCVIFQASFLKIKGFLVVTCN